MFTPEMITSFLTFIKMLTTQMWPFLAVIFGLYIGLWIISGLFEAIWYKKRWNKKLSGQDPDDIDALRDDPEMRGFDYDYFDDLDDY